VVHDGELKAARAELKQVSALLTGSEMVVEQDATADAILGALHDRFLFHFAGHAWSRQDLPLESFLLAARDQRVTAKSILAAAPTSVRLAVLSACHTAVPDLRHVDEVVSLGISLIQAGVAGVIASLWAVDDAATMMLATEYYKHWRGGAVSPHCALAAAQRWMYSSSTQEKCSAYSSALGAAGISMVDIDWARYSHPIYWSAFTHWGA
jgi:CHAT domain-containing protein